MLHKFSYFLILNSQNIYSITDDDFLVIKKYISQFELDNRDLYKEQFLAYKINKVVLGFGRIKNHSDCDELCTLGVVELDRNKGIGKLLVNELIKISKQDLYLVCIIPDFFKPFKFQKTSCLPQGILDKMSYCNKSLPVKETYVAMKLVK